MPGGRASSETGRRRHLFRQPDTVARPNRTRQSDSRLARQNATRRSKRYRRGRKLAHADAATLPGAGNWSHQYAEPGNTASSGDKLVQGGLGVLWYGDPGPEMMVNRHQGAVGPLVVNGRMFIQGETSLMAYDAYNGLFLWEVENPDAVRTGVFQNRAPGNLAASEDLLFHMAARPCLCARRRHGRSQGHLHPASRRWITKRTSGATSLTGTAA